MVPLGEESTWNLEMTMKVGEVEIWSAIAADLFLCRWQALWFFPTSQEGESPPLPKYDQLMSDLDSVFLIIFSIFLFVIIIAMCEKARAYANTVDYCFAHWVIHLFLIGFLRSVVLMSGIKNFTPTSSTDHIGDIDTDHVRADEKSAKKTRTNVEFQILQQQEKDLLSLSFIL